MTDIKQQIRQHLNRLSDRQQAAAFRDWVEQPDNTLESLAAILATQLAQANAEAELELGELDHTLTFQPLTEAEQIQQSLAVLAQYSQTGQAVAQDQVEAWVESLGSDRELPCPQ